MKKSKAGIFTLSSTSLMVCECLISIIVIFLDTFLVSKLLKLTPGDYTAVSIFNVLYYIAIAISTFVLTPLLIKINKSLFMSVGSVLLTGVFIAVYLLGDGIVNYIWLFGILSGFAYGVFCAGFNNLIGEVISSKHQSVYFSVKNMAVFLTKTIFPFILGAIITMSFSVICIVIALISVLVFVFSFLVKPKDGVKKTYRPIKFWKEVKNGGPDMAPLRMLYLSAFFRGLCFDLIATVFTILIFLQSSGSDFKIGLIQTIFTATQLIAMLLFMKFYHKNRSQWFIFGSLALIVLGSIPVFVSHNITSIIIFYGIYMFFRIFITTVTDMRKTPVIRQLSMHSHMLEHNSTYSLINGVTRSLSYMLLLLFFVVPEGIMLNITLAVNIFGYIGYAITLFILERKLILQDIKWKKEHPDPAIIHEEKTTCPKEVLPEKMEKIELTKN